MKHNSQEKTKVYTVISLKIKEKRPSLSRPSNNKTSSNDQPNKNRKKWVAKSKGKTWYRKPTKKAE